VRPRLRPTPGATRQRCAAQACGQNSGRACENLIKELGRQGIGVLQSAEL